MTYVTVYVGCIECGVPTEVIGVFPTEKEAKEAQEWCEAGGSSWDRHGGQGYVEVFGPLDPGNRIDPGGRAKPVSQPSGTPETTGNKPETG